MLNTISIVEVTEANLLTIGNLLAALVKTVENSEGIDLKKALDNCHILLNDANSHFLVAKVEDSVVGFVNFTTGKTILHPGPSGLIDEFIVSEEY